MAEERVQRRLAAIVAADVAGYSRLMGEDEAGTLAAVTAHISELFEPEITAHHGRIFKTMGDAVFAELASVVDAVSCAVALQDGMRERNAETAREQRIEFRIGVNLGDVIVQQDDVFGDGVNVAARLEGLAEPGGICVSDMVHQGIGSKLDLSFDDLGPQRVKNIGEPVRAFRIRFDAVALVPAPARDDAPPLPDRPSIAVLPFDNLSNDPDQEYFADGITEDIITELSKISGLFVIARHSAFTYKGQSVTLKQVGRDLGVRYVLEGSVRKAGSRLRITAQLIDALTDHHVWADRYDRDIEDIFAVQDEVARHVADALAITLRPVERERLARSPTDNLEAYDLYVRARTRAWPPTRDNVHSAQRAFANVIDIDPKFAGGYAGKAIAISMAVLVGQSAAPKDDARLALELAEQAVALDKEFARAYSALGTAYTAMGRHDEAVVAARQAVELQPGDADSHAFHGRCLTYAGLADEACQAIRTALRLDPQYVEGPYLNLLGRALFVAGRYKECVEAFERNVARGGPIAPPIGMIHPRWIAAYSLEGQVDTARAMAKEYLSDRPNFSLARIGEKPEMLCVGELDPLIAGLRKAGLPE